MVPRVLPRAFYARPTIDVARSLLGQILVFGPHRGRILETEAYLPSGDLAAHAAAGLTPRTRILYGPPGHAYVFLNYGIHHCLNVVAEPAGSPGCVLIRAVQGLGDGPGKLTRAAGITLAQNGCDLLNSELRILAAPPPPSINVSSRIGIRRSAHLPLRFAVPDPNL